MLSVLDLGSHNIETPGQVSAYLRIRAGLTFVAAENLKPVPDCGMKYLPRDVAFSKLCALAEGAKIGRQKLGQRD